MSGTGQNRVPRRTTATRPAPKRYPTTYPALANSQAIRSRGARRIVRMGSLADFRVTDYTHDPLDFNQRRDRSEVRAAMATASFDSRSPRMPGRRKSAHKETSSTGTDSRGAALALGSRNTRCPSSRKRQCSRVSEIMRTSKSSPSPSKTSRTIAAVMRGDGGDLPGFGRRSPRPQTKQVRAPAYG